MNMRPQSELTKERSRLTQPMSIEADFLWGGAEALDLGPAAVTGVALDDEYRVHVVLSGAEGAARFFLLPEYADMFESLLSQRFLLSGFPKDDETERNALLPPFSEPRDIGQVNQFGVGRMSHHLFVRSYESPVAVCGQLLAGDLQAFWRELRETLSKVPGERRRPPIRKVYTKRDRDVAIRALDPAKKPPPLVPDHSFDHLFADAPPVVTNLLSEPEEK